MPLRDHLRIYSLKHITETTLLDVIQDEIIDQLTVSTYQK